MVHPSHVHVNVPWLFMAVPWHCHGYGHGLMASHVDGPYKVHGTCRGPSVCTSYLVHYSTGMRQPETPESQGLGRPRHVPCGNAMVRTTA